LQAKQTPWLKGNILFDRLPEEIDPDSKNQELP